MNIFSITFALLVSTTFLCARDFKGQAIRLKQEIAAVEAEWLMPEEGSLSSWEPKTLFMNAFSPCMQLLSEYMKQRVERLIKDSFPELLNSVHYYSLDKFVDHIPYWQLVNSGWKSIDERDALANYYRGRFAIEHSGIVVIGSTLIFDQDICDKYSKEEFRWRCLCALATMREKTPAKSRWALMNVSNEGGQVGRYQANLLLRSTLQACALEPAFTEQLARINEQVMEYNQAALATLCDARSPKLVQLRESLRAELKLFREPLQSILTQK